MKLRDYFSKRASAKSEPAAPPGQQTDWLDFCELVLKGSKVLCADAQFAPSADDGVLVELSSGKYLVQAKCVDYGGDKRVSRLRILREHVVPALGAQLGETWTDTARTGVCDFAVFTNAWGTDNDASFEKISPAFNTSEPFGIAILDKTSGAVLPFVDSGFGDGTFPVFELVVDEKRVGLEIEFIAPGTAYPFGLTPDERANRVLDLRAKSQRGDADAQWTLGRMYLKGEDMAKDANEAVKWLERAAHNGHAAAANDVGEQLFNGVGVPKDMQRAIEFFELAARQEFPQALNSLGVIYRHGHGVPVDMQKAIHYFRAAAEKEDVDAQYNLALHFANGLGIEQNAAEAVKWYRRAADQWHAKAQCNLAVH